MPLFLGATSSNYWRLIIPSWWPWAPRLPETAGANSLAVQLGRLTMADAASYTTISCLFLRQLSMKSNRGLSRLRDKKTPQDSIKAKILPEIKNSAAEMGRSHSPWKGKSSYKPTLSPNFAVVIILYFYHALKSGCLLRRHFPPVRIKGISLNSHTARNYCTYHNSYPPGSNTAYMLDKQLQKTEKMK